jgi:hypothetical protein
MAEAPNQDWIFIETETLLIKLTFRSHMAQTFQRACRSAESADGAIRYLSHRIVNCKTGKIRKESSGNPAGLKTQITFPLSLLSRAYPGCILSHTGSNSTLKMRGKGMIRHIHEMT